MRLKVKGFIKKFEKLKEWILLQNPSVIESLAKNMNMSVSDLEIWLTKVVCDIDKLDSIKIDIERSRS